MWRGLPFSRAPPLHRCVACLVWPRPCVILRGAQHFQRARAYTHASMCIHEHPCFIRMYPFASKCIQVHPCASKCIHVHQRACLMCMIATDKGTPPPVPAPSFFCRLRHVSSPGGEPSDQGRPRYHSTPGIRAVAVCRHLPDAAMLAIIVNSCEGLSVGTGAGAKA